MGRSSPTARGAASALELRWSWLRGRTSPASKVDTGSGVAGAAAPNHCAASSRCSSTKASATASTSLIPVAVERSGRDPSLRAQSRRSPGPSGDLPPGRALASRRRGQQGRTVRGDSGDAPWSRAGGIRRPMGVAGGIRGGADDEGRPGENEGRWGAAAYSATRPIFQTPAAIGLAGPSVPRAGAPAHRRAPPVKTHELADRAFAEVAVHRGGRVGGHRRDLPAFPAPAAPSPVPNPSDHLTPTPGVAVFCSVLLSNRFLSGGENWFLCFVLLRCREELEPEFSGLAFEVSELSVKAVASRRRRCPVRRIPGLRSPSSRSGRRDRARSP